MRRASFSPSGPPLAMRMTRWGKKWRARCPRATKASRWSGSRSRTTAPPLPLKAPKGMPSPDDGARVTAIMPVKDPHPEFLSDALASLATQTSDRWRLLVVVEPEDLDDITARLARWTADPRM